jgi:hypothetical protein
VRLGWSIYPQKRQVEIYRLGQDVEVLEAPSSLSGEDVLPGFMLDLGSIFRSLLLNISKAALAALTAIFVKYLFHVLPTELPKL